MTTNTERLNSVLNLYDVYKHSNPSCSFPSWICDQLMAEEKQARIVEEPKPEFDIAALVQVVNRLNNECAENGRNIAKLMAWARL